MENKKLKGYRIENEVWTDFTVSLKRALRIKADMIKHGWVDTKISRVHYN